MSATNGTNPLPVDQPTAAELSPYGYVPTEWVCIVFISLFGLSTAIHFGQTIYSRLWWLFGTTVLAGIAEIIGWSGRLWSSIQPETLDPFLMQITTTIIAPTPLIAANFIILGQLIKRLGQQYSRLSALWYTIIFCSCDIVALIVQAVGGAQASSAVSNNEDPNPGGNIMLGGIAFQLGAIVVYLLLATEFLLRYVYDKPFRRPAISPPRSPTQRGIKFMVLGLALEGVFLFIRSVYRLIELSDGWSGRIIETQVYFNVLDGAMIVLAMFTLNLFHPGILLGKASTWNVKNSALPPKDYTDAEGDSDSVYQLPEIRPNKGASSSYSYAV